MNYDDLFYSVKARDNDPPIIRGAVNYNNYLITSIALFPRFGSTD